MVSIIIPIYNLECYLSRCLDSCIQQTYSNLEIVCVNDGSIDSSSQIIKDYIDKDSRIILINQKNMGVVTARNSGIAHSKGEFLYFLDGDDFLHPLALEKLMDKMQETGADMVKGNYELVDERDILMKDNKPLFKHLSNGTELFDYLCSTGLGAIWNHLLKKELFITHVSIPQRMSVGEDLYALLQLSQVVQKIMCIEDVTYYYRCRRTSVMNTNYEINPEAAVCFRQKNILFCNILLHYANNKLLSKKQRIDIELLTCDKMVTFIFSLPVHLLKDHPVFLLYVKCFLLNFQVQRRVFKRSWKCYLSVLFDFFKLI